jgi:hypothetical protein
MVVVPFGESGTAIALVGTAAFQLFSWKLDVLQVRIFKVAGVLEAEAKEAVEAHVADPDEGDGIELWLGGEVCDGEQDARRDVSVGEIIGCCSGADVAEIAEHEQVGSEKEDGEQEPAGVKLVVKEDG